MDKYQIGDLHQRTAELRKRIARLDGQSDNLAKANSTPRTRAELQLQLSDLRKELNSYPEGYDQFKSTRITIKRQIEEVEGQIRDAPMQQANFAKIKAKKVEPRKPLVRC